MTRKAPPVNSSINVTPMVDVMLVLLIIFMVITPMLTPGRSVEMAKAQNAEEMKKANSPDALLIAIERGGKIFLGADQVELKDLASRVRDRIDREVEKKAYIKADGRAQYGSVVAVVDEVRAGGVDQLGLLTEKVKFRDPR
jgi:biopolymer transport protein ExbD/biopolymer transport protein TolR